MDAKICDVCGKTFIPGVGRRPSVLGHIVDNKIILKDADCSVTYDREFEYDICDSCLGYLDNWFRVRRAAPVDKEK